MTCIYIYMHICTYMVAYIYIFLCVQGLDGLGFPMTRGAFLRVPHNKAGGSRFMEPPHHPLETRRRVEARQARAE